MLIFSPNEYRDLIPKAIEKFSFLSGEIADISFAQYGNIENLEEEYRDEDLEICIDKNTPVRLSFDEYDDIIIELAEFIRLYSLYDELKLNDSQSYARSNNDVFFLLDQIDYRTYDFLYSLACRKAEELVKPDGTYHMFPSNIELDGNMYSVELHKGFCFYHLLVEESENYNEEYPAYSVDDYFIHISGSPILNMTVADNLAFSYIFELQTTLNLSLAFSKGRPKINDIYFFDERANKIDNQGIFPLLYGKGIPELLKLYYSAKETYELDYKILGFTKVIEYIAPTLARSKLLKDVSLKLTSPAVFSPTPDYINELGSIFNAHANDTNKDSELIRISIFNIISLSEIWNYYPSYLKSKKDAKLKDLSEEMQRQYLDNLANAIYDTRNEIAHAKANYLKKGDECPNSSKKQFGELLDYLAVRCVRWFALQPEDKRVLSL